MKYYTWSDDYDFGEIIVRHNSKKELLKELKEYFNSYKDDRIIVGEEMSVEEFIRRNKK